MNGSSSHSKHLSARIRTEGNAMRMMGLLFHVCRMPDSPSFLVHLKRFSALPAKRRREDTPSQDPEIGRRVGTPMNFGDEYNWGGDMNPGPGMGKSAGAYIPCN
jgi:hypothetical protein